MYDVIAFRPEAAPERAELRPEVPLIEATIGDDLPCRTGDPDLWFAERPAEVELAKQLCAQCPVRAACLSGARGRAEPWGVWGGELFDRGVVIARKRARGRPSRSAA